jgi:hypothetical protein
MGNCASSPEGENQDSIYNKDKQNKTSLKDILLKEREKDKIYSNRMWNNNKNKENPIKVPHKDHKLNTINYDINVLNTKSTNNFLDTNETYEKNLTENFHHRKINSSFNTRLNNDYNPYHKSEILLQTNNNKFINDKYENSNDIYYGINNDDDYYKLSNNKSIYINNFYVDNSTTKENFIKKKEEIKIENTENNMINDKIPSTFIFKKNLDKNLYGQNYDLLKFEENRKIDFLEVDNYNMENIRDEFLKENEIVKEIKHNKIFYNSEYFNFFKKNTPKKNRVDFKNPQSN